MTAPGPASTRRLPSRRLSADTISVTVGSVSKRSHSRTLPAVSSCHSPIAAATDASRTSRDRHTDVTPRGVATTLTAGTTADELIGYPSGHTEPPSAC